jgi:hypothetical protein
MGLHFGLCPLKKKKRTDGLLELLKKVVLEWWTSKPRISYGQNDVTRK